LPPGTQIIGYARSDLTVAKIRTNVSPYVGLRNEEEKTKYEQFWKQVHYVQGLSYDKPSDYAKLEDLFKTIEAGKTVANRLFYYAIPPSAYVTTSKALHEAAMSKRFHF
jgi:glucose-6-phosphate 1-dehydrogenase